MRGRVRMVEKNSTNATGKVVDFADVGLEFSELAFQGRVYHFAANLKTFETPVPGAAVTNFRFVGILWRIRSGPVPSLSICEIPVCRKVR